jgi:tetratricopeptide (TPR) repeat protein
MAWLERLAAQQGANLDELPTVTDFEREPAVVSEMDSAEVPTVFDFPMEDMAEAEVEEPAFDIPDDPDEAMAWLEKLAARQGANLDELPTIDVVEEMATPVTGIVMEAEEFDYEPEAFAEMEVDPELELALADLSDIDMPEDDDEALAWLAAITGETAGAADEESLFETADELFEDTDFEPETFQAFEEFEPVETIEITAVEEPPLSFEEEPSDTSLFDAIEEETDQFFDSEEDLSIDMGEEFGGDALDSALPEWLKFEPVGETSREDLDWLESFGDSNVDSWLEAEELTSQFDLRAISDLPEPEPVAVPEPELIYDSRAPEERGEFLIEDFEVESAPTGPVDENQLESARTALETGDFRSAVEQYNTLLRSGQGLPLLIADLETASNRHTKVAPLQRLLGDAYMQNGQLQKAIDIYRQALDNL